MPSLKDVWVILQIRYEGPFMVLRYRDSQGERGQTTLPVNAGPWSPVIPVGIQDLDPFRKMVERNLSALPLSLPGQDTPPTLALYLAVPKDLRNVSFEDVVTGLLASPTQIATRVQLVRLAPGRWVRRSPFRLPLRLTAMGLAGGLTRVLEERSWYGHENVTDFGLTIEKLGHREGIELANGEPRDIVITTSRADISTMADLPLRQRPRLIVLLENNPSIFPKIPSGTALLQVQGEPFSLGAQAAAPDGTARIVSAPSPEPASFIKRLVYGIIHDLPIHNALSSALPEFHDPVRLVADPRSNQSLRMIDAAAAVRRESIRLEANSEQLDLKQFLTRVAAGSVKRKAVKTSGKASVTRKPATPGRTASLTRIEVGNVLKRTSVKTSGKAFDALRSISEEASLGRAASRDFTYESRGLVPLANMEAKLSALRERLSDAKKTLSKAASDKRIVELLRAHQQRAVDVALERLDTDPILDSVSRDMTLAAGQKYQVRVHIGNQLQDSIVVGPVPPVDPLLPDPDEMTGHVLEVAIQGKDFRVLSRPIKKIYLPVIGGSDPVYFRVRAPEEVGHAQLRILIYHRNHLVQSFLLDAEIRPSEQRQEQAPALGVRLEFSRTERFENLNDLKARALSIGLNQGPGATHQLTVKGDGAMGELNLPPSVFDKRTQAVRTILEVATRDPADPEQSRKWPSLSPGLPPSPELADVIRNLAERGRDLYQALFERVAVDNVPLRKALVRIARGEDKPIQVVRHSSETVFPWTLLYDFRLPKRNGQGQPEAVCLGVRLDSQGQPVACGHTCADRVYCVNGFWGIRHRVEEFLGVGNAADPNVTRPSRVEAVRLVGDATISDLTTLKKDLEREIGTAELAVGPASEDKLLDILWGVPPERPAILIILGHMQTGYKASEPDAGRIVLIDGEEWLTLEELFDRLGTTEEHWSQPRSVVLLMACGSAKITHETLNTFVTTFLSAGAAAVVGAECTIGSDLASRFAKDVAVALWKGTATLGQAITDFRRRVVREGNPLAFVLSGMGDVDLKVQCL